mmetsp:Transcript_5574/g.7366  ORF Transcript_5574/g.7366 Transcript_5574/m.7366 type:complete len:161 (+) Transcript_5574:100-582(+)
MKSLAFSIAKRASLIVSKKAVPQYSMIFRATSARTFSTRVQTFGVDAPDGQADDVLMDEMHELKNIIDIAAATENAAEITKMRQDSKKAFAVDGPDGDSDGHVMDEMHELENIINIAAATENAAEITEMRQESNKVFAVDGPDGDSDGHVMVSLSFWFDL